MVLHPEEMDAAIIRNLPVRTGRSLDEWLDILKGAPAFGRPAQAVDWLKKEHGVGHVSAQVIVRRSTANAVAPPSVEALFPDQERRDLFDHLSAALMAAVPGTVVTATRTYAGFGAPRQYAVAQPSKSGGLTVGLAMLAHDLPTPERASKMGGSARIRWKLRLASASDIATVVRHVTRGESR